MTKEVLMWALALALGGMAGFAYYYFIGCDSGCAISSSPVNSSLYGMGVGGLLKWTSTK